MSRRNLGFLALILIICLAIGLSGQSKVIVAGFTAPPTGPKTAANSDAIVCPTDTAGCEVHQATASNLNATVVGTGTFPIQITTTTTGGYHNYSPTIGASDNHAVIKNGAGTVGYIIVFNNSATVNYGRLYNAGAGFNGCGSATNLIARFQIPASTSVGGFSVPLPPQGMGDFSTGISICVTSGFGDTDTTNATASAISLNIGWN